ncbi:HD domain-containing protein, partial [bacterium]|nr:HD domain-containing protein [bacterium]
QAALKIQANSLLARVAAYYHDIGKITKADYFVENQTERNRHEDLKPTLSASVLKAHVKEGVEKAKKNRLPSEIVDIISQHHGSSLIAYFYHQAEETQDEKNPVNVNDFKYPGPRPQTKEAAIIMLADSVEAACRALIKPTPRRIEETVKKVINNKFIESELAECNLTLSDLTLIADTFSRILTGAYHFRVEYPEKGKVNGNSDSQSAKKKEDRLKEGKKDS